MIKKIWDELFLRKQKTILLKEKQRIEKELKTVGSFPKFGSSDEDNAQEVETFSSYKGLEKGMKNLFSDVCNALKKMENDSYGTCENCKNKIERGRLDAFPSSRYCISCLNKKEKK